VSTLNLWGGTQGAPMQKCPGNPEHAVRLFRVVQHEAEAPDVIASFLYVERTTIKEPTVPDIEWHGRLFPITGVMSYARASVSHLVPVGKLFRITQHSTPP